MQTLIIIAITVISVLGDYFLKVASEHDRSFTSWQFIIGTLLFASTAFGWVVIMKSVKLSEIGVLFSLTYILLLVGLGVVRFNERLSPTEWLGIVLACASIALLRRFS